MCLVNAENTTTEIIFNVKNTSTDIIYARCGILYIGDGSGRFS